jgi:hypothetical protein
LSPDAPIGEHFYFLSNLLLPKKKEEEGWYCVRIHSSGKVEYNCRICGGVIGESEWEIDPRIVLQHEEEHVTHIEQELGNGTVGIVETIQKLGGSWKSASQDVWGEFAKSRLARLAQL